MKIKGTLLLNALLICASLSAQNVFLNRDYWKNSPSLEQVQAAVKAGNDATELNRNAFDATIYAMLEKADATVVKYLLSFDGNPIDKKTHDSRIYLHWAAYAGQVEIVTYLLNQGSSVTELDSHGYTPLAFAANAGQKDKALYETFEKYGVNLLDEKNENGANLLLLVAPYLSTDKDLAYFLDKGFKLSNKDVKGNGIFNYAAKSSNIDFLKLLVAKGVDYKSVNEEGGNAILYASRGTRGSDYNLATFKYLESLGLNANVVGDYGRNPLHRIAHKSSDKDLFEYFVKRGVDVNLQDQGGDSPFMNAANSSTLEVVQFLYPKVKNINAQDENGRSALAMAINQNAAEVAQFLIDKGADISVKDNEGNTLAYYLLNTFDTEDPKEFEDKLKLLEANNVAITKAQNKGNTLVHLATERKDLAALKRLEAFDFDINAKNNEGYTALHIAAMKAQNDTIIKYLLTKGADHTIKTEFDESVFDLASENELLQKNKVSLNFLK